MVSLRFGRDFLPLYLSHPEVDRVVPVDSDAVHRAQVRAEFALEAGFDAPDDLERIIRAADASGRRYMMMESAAYGREYRAIAPIVAAGEFGPLTLYRGFHIQNLDGFPSYWQGYPPMHSATHALSPILAMLDTTVVDVRCLGAGRLSESRRAGGFDNPFPSEVGLFRLRGTDAVAEITMAFFQTAHPYAEGFSLYGERRGCEGPGHDNVAGVLYRMKPPDTGDRGNRVVVEAEPSAGGLWACPLRSPESPSTLTSFVTGSPRRCASSGRVDSAGHRRPPVGARGR